MATGKNSAAKARAPRSLDLGEILHKLSEARDVLDCAYLALEDGEPGKEATCFRVGLEMLGVAHDQLDTALARTAAERLGSLTPTE